MTSTRTTTAAEKSRQIFTLPTDTYEVRANFRSVQLTAWKALMWVKNIFRFWEILLSKHSLFQNKYYFNLYEFLKRRIHALVGKLKKHCLLHILSCPGVGMWHRTIWLSLKINFFIPSSKSRYIFSAASLYLFMRDLRYEDSGDNDKVKAID